MSGPVMHVDLDAIEENARNIVGFCMERGISVTGVTKVTCGMPAVARALLRGGVTSIGESRLENVHRMRADGITAPFWLLRIPPLSEVEEIVTSVNISLNSEIGVIRALSATAEGRDLVHDIVLMVDLGDLREGLWPDDILPTVREIFELPGVRLRGLGTNLTCYGGVLPTVKNMRELTDHKKRVEDTFGRGLDILSGGNSSSLDLLRRGKMPPEVNNLRLGESLMLGRETAFQTLWPGARTDAFVLKAELIEVKDKPSVPVGETGLDAFGDKPVFEDKGPILRGILNIGREDVKVEGLTVLDEELSILGASSDHLLLDLSLRRNTMVVGDEIGFLPDYGALLTAMTSSYVCKEPHHSGKPVGKDRPVLELVGSAMDSIIPGTDRSIGEILEADLSILGSLSGVVRVGTGGRPASHSSVGRDLFLLGGGAGELLEYLEGGEEDRGSLGLVWLTSRPDDRFMMDCFGRPGLLAPGNTVVVGLREAGKIAHEIFESRRLGVYTMEDIDLLGLRQVMRQALHRAAAGTRGVVLRYDASVTDGGNEGLTRRETYLAMEIAFRSGLLRGVDLSGSLPPGDVAAAESLRRYAAAVLGRKILGYTGAL